MGIVLASALFITTLTLIQTAVIMGTGVVLGAGIPSGLGLLVVGAIIVLLVLGVTALSLGLAFALPGHIELLAAIFIVNLPLLFASTALAPLSFMPPWLQWIAALNPLSYAIEPIRYLYLHSEWSWSSTVLAAPFGNVSFGASLLVLLGIDLILLIATQPLLRRRMA